jgi:hypothetical protein
MFEMLSKSKKLLVSLLTFVMVISISIPAFAHMAASGYTSFSWYQFDILYEGQGNNDFNRRQTRLIQRACNAVEDSGLVADGIFGPMTTIGVEDVQHEAGLYIDGITWSDTRTSFQTFYFDHDWVKSGLVNAGGGVYYYQYKGDSDGAYYIRHYNNGEWKVKGSDGNWYIVLT